MTEINMNSVQNRFTAYLVAAVTNQRGGLGCAGGKSHWSCIHDYAQQDVAFRRLK